MSNTQAERVEALDLLVAFAEGRLQHQNMGLCPDAIEGPDVRDPECAVCCAITAVADRTADDALRADAERYRWLRQYPNNVGAAVYAPTVSLLRRDTYLDAAIDAARNTTQQQGG